MPEGSVDDGIGRGCSAAQAFQVLQIASMRLGARGKERFGACIAASQSEDLMVRTDKFFHDGGTDKSCSAGNEYTHMSLPDLIRARLTKGGGLD